MIFIYPHFEEDKVTGKLREVYKVDDTYGGYLFHFPALQRISIVMFPSNNVIKDSTVGIVKRFVEHHKERFYGDQAPEVVGIDYV
jgi:hypothetical protein